MDAGINAQFVKKPIKFRKYAKTSSPADDFMFRNWRHLNQKGGRCAVRATKQHPLPIASFVKALKALQDKAGAQIQATLPGYGLGSIVAGLSKAMLVSWKRKLPMAAPPLGKFRNAKECPKGTWDCLLANFPAPSSFNESARGNGLKIEAEMPWLEKFSMSLPYAMPDAWGKTGSFALTGTLMNFVLEPSVSLTAEMETQRRKIGLDKVKPGDIISMVSDPQA